MSIAQVNSDGLIALPEDIRDEFGLKPGDSFEVRVDDHHIVMIPVKRKEYPSSVAPSRSIMHSTLEKSERSRGANRPGVLLVKNPQVVVEAVVDANVLIRMLADEPSDLAILSGEILDRAIDIGIILLVSSLTIAEVVYVLESVYRWDRDTIANKLIDLISATDLRFPEKSILLQTLSYYKSTRQLHFADAYVVATAMSRGHGTVVSFDQEFRRVPGLTIIQDTSDIE